MRLSGFDPSEARNAKGEWTAGGGGDRAKLIARHKELLPKIQTLGNKGGLTAAEAKEYETLTDEMHSILFDVAKPLTIEKVPPAAERKSTLFPEVVVAAQHDLLKSKDIYMAIATAAAGVHYNAHTEVDDIVSGKNNAVSAEAFYKNFSASRDALRKQYGDTVPCFRAEGNQAQKPTKNWATTYEFAANFGNNVVQRNIPVDKVLAVMVGLKGVYHELIVDATNEARNAKGVADRVSRAVGAFTSAGGYIDLLDKPTLRSLAKSVPQEGKTTSIAIALKRAVSEGFYKVAVSKDKDDAVTGMISYLEHGGDVSLHDLWTSKTLKGSGVALVQHAAERVKPGGEMSVLRSTNDGFHKAMGGTQPLGMRGFWWTYEDAATIAKSGRGEDLIATTKFSAGLENEIETKLDSAEPEEGKAFTRAHAIKELMQDADEKGHPAEEFRKELEDFGIKIGVYREIMKAEMERTTVMGGGKKHDFKRGVKAYVFDSWKPLDATN